MKVAENTLSEFVDTLIVWEAEISEKLRTNRAMNWLNARQQEEFNNATRCYICRHEFVEGEAKGLKVHDHDHKTGCFNADAHRQSNLERPVCFKIPEFFYNFRGYDAHLIVHEFRKRPDREIKVNGQNLEKYLQVEWGPNMVFRDSRQFLSASLKQLAASLAKVGRKNFQNLHDLVTDVYPEADVELLERKRVFCYDYLNSLARLDKPSLPFREAFFNKIGCVECTPAYYAHTQHVWDNFDCSSLKNTWRSTFWVICLLADVCHAIRNQSLDEYPLDPAYFVSAPQLALNALLKHIDRLSRWSPTRRCIGLSSRTSAAEFATQASVMPALTTSLWARSTTRGSRPRTSSKWTQTTSTAGPCCRRGMMVILSGWATTNAATLSSSNYANGRIAIFDIRLFDH